MNRDAENDNTLIRITKENGGSSPLKKDQIEDGTRMSDKIVYHFSKNADHRVRGKERP